MDVYKKNRISVKDMTLMAMFAAVLAVAAQISIPLFGVPLTLQTFGVALCGMMLGWKRGMGAVLIYVLIGTFGMPVFSNFRGGPGVLFGKSGGFILGFLPMALLCGFGAQTKNKILFIAYPVLGLIGCHLLGTLQFALVSHMGWMTSVLMVSVPFLVKDGVSILAAGLAAKAVFKRMGSSGRFLSASHIRK